MHSTRKLPGVMNVPRCNIADIHWYVRMPTDPPPVDPKVEMLSEVCEEEGVTLDQPSQDG